MAEDTSARLAVPFALVLYFAGKLISVPHTSDLTADLISQ